MLCAIASSLTLSTMVAAGGPEFDATLVATFETWPIGIAHAPADFDRMFVHDREGRIWIVENGLLVAEPFLDLSDFTQQFGGAQGLLGLAFHPDYQTNGFFYVNYTREPDGASTVVRYEVTVDPNVADPASAEVVITIPQPTVQHNGGWIGFSPNNGFLHVALGFGGGGNDVDDSQNLDVLLGKVLRIDVDGDDFPGDPDRNYAVPPDNPFVGVDGADEIWVYGFRNPWRCSFDSLTGDLYVCDVGSLLWEEVNFQSASSAGGENYGWDCREGSKCVDPPPPPVTCDCDDETLVDPIFEFINEGGTSIIGGHVYRGCAIPALEGAFVFAIRRFDSTLPAFALRHDDGVVTEVLDIQSQFPGGGTGLKLASFGEDAAGELYFCDTDSKGLFKIVPLPRVEDLDGDGNVTVADLLMLLGGWGTDPGGPPDFDGSGSVDVPDLLALLAAWGPCP